MEDELLKIYEALKNDIRRKCSLPPGRPNSEEMKLILIEINKIPKFELNINTWKKVVLKYVKSDTFYFEKGLDLSDLNLLYSRLMALLDKGDADGS